jgi:hypothetical protein
VSPEGLSRSRAFRAACDAGARTLLSGAVQFQTAEKYWRDWRKWVDFLGLYFGYSSDDNNFLQHMALPAQVRMLACFIFYAFTQLHLKSTTVTSVMSGIAHHFRLNMLSMDAFSHRSIAACKSAMQLRERALEEPVLIERKYPITLSMVEEMENHHHRRGAPVDIMLAMAVRLAFVCLLRSSEYIPSHKGNDVLNRCHAFRAKDIDYECVDGSGVATWIPSWQVTEAMRPYVRTIRFYLRSAKNDKLRMGNLFFFTNQSNYSGGLSFVMRCFDWSIYAGHGAESFWMSQRIGSSNNFRVLTYVQMVTAIKDCAYRHGLDPARYSTHSCRVGGACTLRAGGASDSMIELLGRWKDVRTALGYTECSYREFDKMQEVLCNPTIFTLRDVHLLHDKMDSRAASGAPSAEAVFSGKTVNFRG